MEPDTMLLTVERFLPTPVGIFVTEPTFSVADAKMDGSTLECLGVVESKEETIRDTRIVFNVGHINMGGHLPDEISDLYPISVCLPDLTEREVLVGSRIFVSHEIASKFPKKWPQSKK